MTRFTKWSLFALLLVVLLVGGFLAWHAHLQGKVDAELAAIRAAGYPTTGAELNAWYAMPEGENAADAYMDAIDAMVDANTALAPLVPDVKPKVEEEPDDFDMPMPTYGGEWSVTEKTPETKLAESLPIVGSAKLPDVDQPLDAETMKLVDAYLAANAEALRLLHEAAKTKEPARHNADFTQGFDGLPPRGGLRQSCNALALEAVAAGDKGDGEAATRALEAAFAVGHSLRNEPTVVSQLVRISCTALPAAMIERIGHRAALSDAQMARLIEKLQTAEASDAMERAFAGERAVVNDMLVRRTPLDPPVSGGADLRLSGIWTMDHALYLQYMSELVNAMKKPYRERAAAATAADAGVRAKSKVHGLLHAIAPSLSMPPKIELRGLASMRATQAGLAVMRYRQAEGKLPAKLADVAPRFIDKLPDDPYTGKPLRYVTKPDGGFTVYSVSEDGADDGGTDLDATGKPYGPGTDITFTVKGTAASLR